MSASTNLHHNLEHELASLLGEREAIRAELRIIEEGLSKLPTLHERVRVLDEVIAATKTLLKHDRPNYEPKSVKPRRKYKIDDDSPFKPGERGRTALGILGEDGGWMRPLDIAKAMLDSKGWDPADRVMREKLTKAIMAYFRKHDGDLVESNEQYGANWRVIRR